MEKVSKDNKVKSRNTKLFSSSTKIPKLKEDIKNNESKPPGLKAYLLNIFRKNNTHPDNKTVAEPKSKKIFSELSCPKPPAHKPHKKKHISSSKKSNKQHTKKFNAFPSGFTPSSLKFPLSEDFSIGKSLVKKEDMIKEGIKLTKLSEKFKPKSFALKQAKTQKSWIHLSKKEKGLAREQKSLQRKLEDLYQP